MNKKQELLKRFNEEFVEIQDAETDNAYPSLVSPNPDPIEQFLSDSLDEYMDEIIKMIDDNINTDGWWKNKEGEICFTVRGDLLINQLKQLK